MVYIILTSNDIDLIDYMWRAVVEKGEKGEFSLSLSRLILPIPFVSLVINYYYSRYVCVSAREPLSLFLSGV